MNKNSIILKITTKLILCWPSTASHDTLKSGLYTAWDPIGENWFFIFQWLSIGDRLSFSDVDLWLPFLSGWNPIRYIPMQVMCKLHSFCDFICSLVLLYLEGLVPCFSSVAMTSSFVGFLSHGEKELMDTSH